MDVYVAGIIFSILFTAMTVNLSRNQQYYIEKHGPLTKIHKKIFAFFSCVPLTVIAAVRYDVGTDTMMYYREFAAQTSRYDNNGEYLFSFLMKGVHAFTSEPQVFFAVSSVLLYGGYFYSIYKNSQNPVLSVLLFFLSTEYFRSLNIMRQYLATAVLLLSLSALENRKLKLVIPFVIVAFFIHKSSAAFLIIVILSQFQINPLILLAGLGIVSIFASGIAALIRMYTSYGGYFFSVFSESEFAFVSLIVYMAFLLVLLYLYFLQKSKFNKKMWILLYAVCFGIFFCILSTVLPNNASRMQYYADALIVIYAPSMLIELKPEVVSSVVKWGMIAGYFALLLNSVVKGHHEVLPYQAFWQ